MRQTLYIDSETKKLLPATKVTMIQYNKRNDDIVNCIHSKIYRYYEILKSERYYKHKTKRIREDKEAKIIKHCATQIGM